MGDMNPSQKAQNLARIRDNQRRSRARRKEYLHELEAKLRACEQTGIEASAEIQSAARKVLDENRKLRMLLHERGVPEGDIVASLGGHPERSYDQISCVPSLNTMLERKLTCGGLSSSCTSSPISSHDRSTSVPRHPPAVPAISIPRTAAPLSTNDTPSPNSMVSSMGTPPPGYNSLPFYTAPETPPAPEIKTEDIAYNYPYDQAYSGPWAYTSDVNDSNYVTHSNSYYNSTSCVDAANIIRTMRSDIGPELENELGCQVPEQDCYVNNTVVFNMMDKYSHQQGNM